jgi:hypothetical protein
MHGSALQVAALVALLFSSGSEAEAAHTATTNKNLVHVQSSQADRSGDDCGTELATAVAGLPGSGGEVRPPSCKGPATIPGLVISKPTKLLLCGAQWSLAPGQTIRIQSDFTLAGCNRAATSIRAAEGQPIFSPSGTKTRNIDISGVTLIGNGPRSQVISFPDFERGVQDFSQGRYFFHDLLVRNFGPGAFALDFGRSTYQVAIDGNIFQGNASGSIRAARDAEPTITRNSFWSPGGGPQIQLEGHSLAVVTGNDFERNAATSTDPDILFTPDRAGNTGYIWIAENKFGPEGESRARYKIRVAPMTGDKAPRSAINVYISQNTFSCAPHQKAIRLESPILGWLVVGNYVNSCSSLISDAQPLSSVSGQVQGGSILKDNRVLADSSETDLHVCDNGCRGFSVVEPFAGAATADVFNAAIPIRPATERLQNRLKYSEDFANQAWKPNGVSVTAGQKDPWGGLRASILKRAGTNDSESISQVFSGGTQGRVYFTTFWAKAGTAKNAVHSLYDVTEGKFLEHMPIYLDPQWRRYTTVFRGAAPGHSFAWYLYPGGFKAEPVSMSLCCVQVADQDSDYVPTSGQPVDDAGGGFRVEGTAHFAGQVTLRQPVVIKTARYQITAEDSNTCFVNSAATAEVVFTLPAATPGFTACFAVDAAQRVTVRSAGTNVMQMAGNSGTELSSSSPGDTVTVMAISTSKYIVSNRQGTWTLR